MADNRHTRVRESIDLPRMAKSWRTLNVIQGVKCFSFKTLFIKVVYATIVRNKMDDNKGKEMNARERERGG